MFITYLSYHRRKRWRFDWGETAFSRPPAQIITLPVLLRLIPIQRPRPDQMPNVDHQQLLDLLHKQVGLTPSNYLGVKIGLLFRALELEIGEEAASRQVFAIVNEYLAEKQAVNS